MQNTHTNTKLMAFHYKKRHLIVAIEAGVRSGVDVARLEALLRTNREETTKFLDTLPGRL